MFEIVGHVDQNHGVSASESRQHPGEHGRYQGARLVGGAVSAEDIKSDAVLPQVLPDIGVALDIGVVEHRRVIPRRGFVYPAGQRPKPRNRIDGDNVLRTTLAEDTADARRQGGLADATLA